MTDIQFFLIIHLVSIGQDINVLEIRHHIILQSKSHLHSRRTDQYGNVILVFNPYKMEFLFDLNW